MSYCRICNEAADYYVDVKHAPECPYAHAELMRSMPMPRLQLRWTSNPGNVDGMRYMCHYELIIPLQEYDVRNDAKQGFQAVVLGQTRRGGGGEPNDEPFRDGVHAQLDSQVLGGLPIYLIMRDGTYREIERKPL